MKITGSGDSGNGRILKILVRVEELPDIPFTWRIVYLSREIFSGRFWRKKPAIKVIDLDRINFKNDYISW